MASRSKMPDRKHAKAQSARDKRHLKLVPLNLPANIERQAGAVERLLQRRARGAPVRIQHPRELGKRDKRCPFWNLQIGRRDYNGPVGSKRPNLELAIQVLGLRNLEDRRVDL